MSINIKFQLGSVDKIPATATITMTLEEWKDLRDQQSSRWPGSKFTDAINDVVSQMEKTHLHFGASDG
jgi:hypothetical protein